MNYLIPAVFLISIIGIVTYLLIERFNEENECDCDVYNSSKKPYCKKCK
jgi:hypothetical protein